MIKLIITFFNMLILIALQLFQDNISIRLEVPGQVQAGSEFDVKVILNKGDLDGFSRLQQNFPAGLTATSGNSADADFTFTEKRVRFIWLRTPQTGEIAVTYHVKIDERLKGTFMLGGKFSYIENNERKSVDIDPVTINIEPSPEVDPSLIVDVNDFDKMAIPYPAAMPVDAEDIACIRQQPYKGSQGDYIVNVLVNKKSARLFAKIEEDVPQGYTAVAIDSKNAIFTFKDQKVKFLWMNLPAASYFTVSYRLIPKNNASLPAPQIKGAFSFLVDDKTLSVDIMERNVDLADISGENIDELVSEALSQQTPVYTQVAATETTTEKSLPEEKSDEKPLPVNEKKPPPATSDKPGATNNLVTNGRNAASSNLLIPETGVYYRIQVAAGHKMVNISRYFRNMNLEKEVRKEVHEGWQKYSIGSFSLYKDARDYRVHIWNTTPVKDAFITAYNNGTRITVQEALMITEQKWYR